MQLSYEHLEQLRRAYAQLEDPGWLPKATSRLGQVVSSPLERLPASVQSALNTATQRSIRGALDLALRTVNLDEVAPARKGLDKTLTGLTGAAGGALGISGLAAELPVTTTLMLRAIATIAREHGEDLNQLETRLACIQVFAFGAPGEEDDNAESGYFTIRASLAQGVSEALKQATSNAAMSGSSPILVRLIKQVASRFGIVVSQKAAVQLVPVLGALGGSAINIAFTHHYQTVADGHFCIRRLERIYGVEAVRAAYLRFGPSE